MRRSGFLLPFLLLTLVSCTKSRDPIVAQGQGKNLEMTRTFDGKRFVVKTGKAIDGTHQHSAREMVGAEEAGLPMYPLVAYETKAALMPKDIEFRGKENWKYEVLYRVSNNYLKVYKVGLQEDIDWTEQTYAEKLEDGRLAVPLVGYPISHIKLEAARNSNRKKTTQWIEVAAQSKQEGQYFRINTRNYVRFEALNKANVFPVEFFALNNDSQEWYMAQAVMDMSGANEQYAGIHTLARDLEQAFASRVRFVRSGPNTMKVINTVSDPGYGDREVFKSDVMTFPARYINYHVARDGDEKGLREEIDDNVHYKNRRFIHVDFANFIMDETGSNKELVEVEVAEGFFSFSVLSVNQGIKQKIKFSFKHAPKNRTYKARYAYRDDLKMFGAINRRLKRVHNSKIYTRSDFDETRVITRHDPRKIVEYRLSESSDTPEYRELAQKMINIWQRSLSENQVGLRLKLSDKAASLGDIRYNIIHFANPNRDLGKWAGVNTSVVDPETGEIISTVVNIYVSSIEAGIERTLLAIARDRVGLTKSRKIFSDVEIMPGGVATATGPEVQGINAYLNNMFEPQLASLTGFKNGSYEGVSSETGRELLAPFSQLGVLDQLGWFDFQSGKGTDIGLMSSMDDPDIPGVIKKGGLNHFNCSLSISHKAMIDRMQELCGDLIAYLDNLKGPSLPITLEFDKDKIRACVKKLAARELLVTGLHEIGHSLGQDHNYASSTDKLNFFKESDNVEAENLRATTASLMEYMGHQSHLLMRPGKYDVATIRYIYDHVVQLKNGKWVRLDEGRTLLDVVSSYDELWPYKFCNDRDATFHLDPMCNVFDAGVTPLEITDNFIALYNTIVSNNFYRYEKVMTPNPSQLNYMIISKIFLPLKRIYDEYRFHMARSFWGQRYLNQFDEVGYEEFLPKNWEEAPGFSEMARLYGPAGQKIKEFFHRIMFIPDHYCVAKTNTGESRAIELFRIRNIVSPNIDEPLMSCFDSRVKDYLTSIDLELVDEAGHPMRSTRFGGKITHIDEEPLDVVGLGPMRVNAAFVAGLRLKSHPAYSTRNFYPSLMDEPDFRTKTMEAIQQRALKGVELEGYETRFLNFADDFQYLLPMYAMLRRAMGHPEGPYTSTGERSVPYQVVITSNPFALQSVGVIELGGLKISVMSAESEVSLKYLHRMRMLLEVRKGKKLDKKTLQPALEVVENQLGEKNPNPVRIYHLYKFSNEMRMLGFKHSALTTHMGALFHQEINVVQKIVDRLLEQMHAMGGMVGEVDTEELMRLFSEKRIDEILTADNYNETFRKEMLKARVEAYVKEFNSLVDQYKTRPEEIDSQLDLLFSYLIIQ